jgi:hypothetical protein
MEVALLMLRETSLCEGVGDHKKCAESEVNTNAMTMQTGQ